MQTLELMRESLRQTCKIEDDEGVSLLGRPVPRQFFHFSRICFPDLLKHKIHSCRTRLLAFPH